MGWYLVKQPNGLLARFSDNVSHFTHYGMTEEEAIWMCASEYKMRSEASKEAVEGAVQDYPTWPNVSKKPGDGLSRWRKALEWVETVHGKEERESVEAEILADGRFSVTPTFPVEAAEDFAESYILRQVIICAWDGKTTHVVTYGGTVDDSDQAAEGGNRVKKALGWPETLQAESPKVTALREELAATKALLATREATLDDIVYKCADYDSELCMADSMLDNQEPEDKRTLSYHNGKQNAGVEIDKLITDSGYKAKERPE